MAIGIYALWDGSIDSSSHWFMMQIGMMLGFLTSWPVNHRLLTKGVKEPMMAEQDTDPRRTPGRVDLVVLGERLGAV